MVTVGGAVTLTRASDQAATPRDRHWCFLSKKPCLSLTLPLSDPAGRRGRWRARGGGLCRGRRLPGETDGPNRHHPLLQPSPDRRPRSLPPSPLPNRRPLSSPPHTRPQLKRRSLARRSSGCSRPPSCSSPPSSLRPSSRSAMLATAASGWISRGREGRSMTRSGRGWQRLSERSRIGCV